MNKKISMVILSVAATSLVFGSEIQGENQIFNQKNISEPSVINKDIQPQENYSNRKIVETVAQYKAYMDERDAIRVKEEQKRLIQMNEQSCDINKLKSAVAKIIKRLDSLENNASSSEIESLKDKIKMMELQMNNSPKDIEPRKVCSTKKIPVNSGKINIGGSTDNESSYLKFKEQKKFKTKYEIPTYKYPAINSEVLPEKLKANTEFKADMYTKFGWVHIENGGWVKGYALSPRFMPAKILKANAIEYKEVTNCQVVK